MIARRTFVKGLGAAGVGLLGHARTGFAADPPPEPTRIRLSRDAVDVEVGPEVAAADAVPQARHDGLFPFVKQLAEARPKLGVVACELRDEIPEGTPTADCAGLELVYWANVDHLLHLLLSPSAGIGFIQV